MKRTRQSSSSTIRHYSWNRLQAESVLADMQVLERLPMVEVQWRHPQLRSKKGSEGGQAALQEYQLEIQLKRVSAKRGPGLSRVYAPRFPKVGLCITCSAAYYATGMHVRSCVWNVTIDWCVVPVCFQSCADHARVPKCHCMNGLLVPVG